MQPIGLLKLLQGRQKKLEVRNDTYYEIYCTGTKMLNRCKDFTEIVVIEPERETTLKFSGIYCNLSFKLIF